MKLVFAGSGAFGVPCLEALVRSSHDVVLAVAQPDRPAGRKKVLTPPPAAVAATALGLPLFQPERINHKDARSHLEQFAPDVMVVIAYGQLLRPRVLELPRLGCVNVHGSLLPRHRGASPIAAAILAGDPISGVTVMQLDEGMDTGPILLTEETPIGSRETTGELHDRLAAMAPPVLLRALEEWESGALSPRPQDDAEASHCGLIDKHDGWLDWSQPAVLLERRLRAMTPWPGAHGIADRAEGGELRVGFDAAHVVEGDGEPGEVVLAKDGLLVVATSKGCLSLDMLKPAGKRSMDAGAFLRGYRIAAGDRFRSRA